MGDQDNAVSNVETIGGLAAAVLHNTIYPPSQFIAYVRILLFHYLQSDQWRISLVSAISNRVLSELSTNLREVSQCFGVWLAKILKHLYFTSTSLLTMFKRLSII